MSKKLKVRYGLAVGSVLAWGIAMFSLTESSFLHRSWDGSATTGPAAYATERRVTPAVDTDWDRVRLSLAAKCVGCHRPGTDLPDLTNYQAIMAAKTERGEPLIVRGQVKDSWLWEMVIWNSSHEPDSEYPDKPEMPRKNGTDRLTGDELTALEHWISNGAHEFRL